eukprot:TRINITY_DN3726_c1_g1_i1.p1 TRINITY_DN3726_c1_g1~~TRINITY_DN3726_c1_g1_i1.p1  ORF type:complete len:1541 (+),score=631.61 TRINITY_DN3726_c1_g1_i1:61-4623(+)
MTTKLSEEQLALLAPNGSVEKDQYVVHLLERELQLKARKLASGADADDKLAREIEKKMTLYIKRCALAAVYYGAREGEAEGALAADCVAKVELYGSESNPLKDVTNSSSATAKLMLFGYEELLGMYTALGYGDAHDKVVAAKEKVASYTQKVKHEKRLRKAAKAHLATKLLMKPLEEQAGEDAEAAEPSEEKPKKKKKKKQKSQVAENDIDVACVEDIDESDAAGATASEAPSVSGAEVSGDEAGKKKKKKRKVKAKAKEGFVEADVDLGLSEDDVAKKEAIQQKMKRLQALKKMKKAAMVASMVPSSPQDVAEPQRSASELFKQALRDEQQPASPLSPKTPTTPRTPPEPVEQEPAPPALADEPSAPPSPAPAGDAAQAPDEQEPAHAFRPATPGTPATPPGGSDAEGTPPEARVVQVQRKESDGAVPSGPTMTVTQHERPDAVEGEEPVDVVAKPSGDVEAPEPLTPTAGDTAGVAEEEAAAGQPAAEEVEGAAEQPAEEGPVAPTTPTTPTSPAKPVEPPLDYEPPAPGTDVVQEGLAGPPATASGPRPVDRDAEKKKAAAAAAAKKRAEEEERQAAQQRPVAIPDGVKGLKRPKAPGAGGRHRKSLFEEEKQADAWMTPLSPGIGESGGVKAALGPALPEDMYREAREVQGLEDFRYLDKPTDAKSLSSDRRHQLTMAVLKGRDAKFRLLAKDVSRHFSQELVDLWVRLAASAGSPALVARLVKDFNADVDAADETTGLALLHQATRSGHAKVVGELLKLGAAVDPLDGKQRTPLHLACMYGEKDTALLLIKYGADVSTVDVYFNTPLQYASSAHLQEVQSMLVKKGALDQLYSSDADATQRLLTACERAEEDVALLLIDHGAADLGFCEETSPLHLCCLNEMKDAVQMLLVKGVSVNPISSGGLTPLHIASCLNAEIVKMLTSGGAHVEIEDRHGNTALHYAIRSHQDDIACLLCARAPQIMDHGNQSGATALHMAVTEGLPKVLRALFTSGANLNVVDEMKNSALHLACSLEKPAFAAALIHQGCDVDMFNHAGYPPILYACANRMSDVAIQLIKRGCNVNVADKNGYTVLHYACTNSMAVVCWALFKVPNVEVTGRSKTGVTILHVAASSNLKDVLETLLVRGCHIGAVDRKGNTALHYACLHQCPEAAEFLLAMGAKPNVVNAQGYTPLDYAVLAHGEEVRPSSGGVGSKHYADFYKLKFKKTVTDDTVVPAAPDAEAPAEQTRSPGFEMDGGVVSLAPHDDAASPAAMMLSDPNGDGESDEFHVMSSLREGSTEAHVPHAAGAMPVPDGHTTDGEDASSADGWTNPASSMVMSAPATPADQGVRAPDQHGSALTRADIEIGSLATPASFDQQGSTLTRADIEIGSLATPATPAIATPAQVTGLPPRCTPRQAISREGPRPDSSSRVDMSASKRTSGASASQRPGSVGRPGSASSRLSARSNPSLLRRYSEMAIKDSESMEDGQRGSATEQQPARPSSRPTSVLSPQEHAPPGMGFQADSDDEDEAEMAVEL